MDFQGFYEGNVFDAYEYLGAHVAAGGVVFRTFAPQAQRVAVIGEFNSWQEWYMECPERSGFWEIYIDGAHAGQMYKYVIYGSNGRVEHCDPYGFGMELRPNFASIIRDLREYTFQDWDWMRSRSLNFDKPMHIYELHMGSWKRRTQAESSAAGNPDGLLDDDEKCEDLVAKNGWYHYDEIADELIAYVKKYGFTHVEFMPLAEHPFDGSWGYQQTGFFAPTARYGTAAELMHLIDRLHGEGIGAILDFVPAHFANDYYALRRYDGSELYEYPSSDVSDSEWGSCNFIFSRREIACFMQSAANYWLKEYHFDGLRMDAVSRLIYWMGNEARGVNTTSVDFLRKMNRGIRALHPTAMLIAEDSTSFPACTAPADQGGLGFDYKWDLGWMNDTLDYIMKTSDERRGVPEKLTFSMFYFYNEKYILPLSHDEVVHGKRTVIDKIYGTYEEKFKTCRAFYLYMMMHPGKKLNFMGNEIAMFREWDETREMDTFLLKYPAHDSFSHYFMELGRLYKEYPAFYEMDYDPAGFRWGAINDNGRDIYGITRKACDGSALAALFNFSASPVTYWVHPEKACTLTVLLHSEWERFGGEVKEEKVVLEAEPVEGVPVELPGLCGVLFEVR